MIQARKQGNSGTLDIIRLYLPTMTGERGFRTVNYQIFRLRVVPSPREPFIILAYILVSLNIFY